MCIWDNKRKMKDSENRKSTAWTDILDSIWFTCCALHHWLLDIDRLNEQWKQGVQMDWEGFLGNSDSTDV